MGLRDLVFGRPIATEEGDHEQVSSYAGVPILGLDALASAAYGPEALLTVLLPLGAGALRWLSWLTPVTVLVLLLVFLSYRQTLPAYPNGGGAYTVAKENLGQAPSLLAAAALSLDYVLNVAVAIAAGVGALVSAVPWLLPHTLGVALLVLVMLTLVNLRGVRSTGVLFMAPAYSFIVCMLALIALGVYRALSADFHPHALVAPPALQPTTELASVALVLHAFANGCTALTGVEAVSNGVPIFRPPTVKNARRALTLIVVVLAVLLLGEAFLCRVYGVVATAPGQPGFQSVLSMLLGAVVGHGSFYKLAMASIVIVVLLSANTSFADFPRLCRILALDRFLPEPFVHRGRRLAFSYGVLLLSVLSALLLIAFGGITDRLIPLFAIGALSAFTMSQLGMVGHWQRSREPGARHRLLLNALGAGATGLTLLVVLVAKFAEGAWISLLLVAGIVLLLRRVHRHYGSIVANTETAQPLELGPHEPPLVLVPLRRWDAVSIKALRLARQFSAEVTVVQVLTHDRETEDLRPRWQELVLDPAARDGERAPELVVLESEYRDLLAPLLRYVRARADERAERQVAVVVPQLVEPRWYHYLLHNHTPTLLTASLLQHGGPQVVVIRAPWHLDKARTERALSRRAQAAPATSSGGEGEGEGASVRIARR